VRKLALLLLTSLASVSAAQDKAPEEQAGGKYKAIPGYKRMKIEGFTVLVSDDANGHLDDPHYKFTPQQALQLELKTITELFKVHSVKLLRRVLIWVEWNHMLKDANGRTSTPEALYYGYSPEAMLQAGMNPLKSNSIIILRLDMLTEEHQPGLDYGRCVILHEMAHAVHHQILGFNNSDVKAAYAQAMDQKLYGPDRYIATNDREFFAETTCAYFGQLHHYPRTRDELRKHDPFSCKLMETVWGKQKSTAVALDSGRVSKLRAGTNADKPPQYSTANGAPLSEVRKSWDLIVGKWTPSSDDGDGLVTEFTKDRRIVVSGTKAGREIKVEGAYRFFSENELEITLTEAGQKKRRTLTVAHISEDEMTTADATNKEEKFKRVK
jgi:uncharacterized protein (TIGR03066 family)